MKLKLKLNAFTLVEVLITIGIIGVVAAITIPLLIQNSNSKKFATQFKKSVSTLDQAAIGAQAQYDMNYSSLTTASQDSSCATDTLAAGQYTMCGLLNNTLSGHTYSGKYGVVKGVNHTDAYVANVSSFSLNNFLIFSFADGAFVAFNSNAKDCSVGSGSVISSDMLTSGNLASCLGFIDVNGATPPNKEVKCAEGDTVLAINSSCKVTNATMGDIFPIVFFNGGVEPSTNASLAVLLGGNGKEEVQAPKPKTAAQLAAERVTNEDDRNILLQVDDVKNEALRMYQQSGYADLDTPGARRGLGNTAMYYVTPKRDGTFEIRDSGQINGAQTFWDFDDLYKNGYVVFVTGDQALTNIKLKETADGGVKAYAKKYHLYVNQWHEATPVNMGYDI